MLSELIKRELLAEARPRRVSTAVVTPGVGLVGPRTAGRVAALLSLLIAGGCMVGPDYRSPAAPVAEAWLEAEDPSVKVAEVDDRAWWAVFDDPILNDLIEVAYQQNLDLQSAGLRVIQARAQLGVAIGEFFPQTQQLTTSITYNRQSQRAPFAQDVFSSSYFEFWQNTFGAQVSWELDFWGKFRRNIQSADYAFLQSVANYDAALVTLLADVASTYILLRTLEKQLVIARSNVEVQRQGLQIATLRFEGGVTSERDVQQAITVLASTEATVPSLEAQIRQAKNALAVLLGVPPGAIDERLASVSPTPAVAPATADSPLDDSSLLAPSKTGLPPIPGSTGDPLGRSALIPPAPPEVAVGIPADLLRRRPDLRAAELRAAAQSAQIGVAKADLYPSFVLNGSFGSLSSDWGTFELADAFKPKGRQFSFGPTVQWNILNYGQITNNVRVQDALFQQLLVDYQNTVLRAQREVEDALIAFLNARRQADFQRRAAIAAKRAVELAFLQYSEGIADFTTVLTAEQDLLRQQQSLVSVLGDIPRNLVAVYRALGGGWQLREGQDFVNADIRRTMAQRTDWGNVLTPVNLLRPQPPGLPAPDNRGRTLRAPEF